MWWESFHIVGKLDWFLLIVLYRDDDIAIAGVEELQESPYHEVAFGELDTR